MRRNLDGLRKRIIGYFGALACAMYDVPYENHAIYIRGAVYPCLSFALKTLFLSPNSCAKGKIYWA